MHVAKQDKSSRKQPEKSGFAPFPVEALWQTTVLVLCIFAYVRSMARDAARVDAGQLPVIRALTDTTDQGPRKEEAIKAALHGSDGSPY